MDIFWSIFPSIFILCISFLTRLFPTARLGQFTPKKSRDKKSRKKKGLKTVGKKNCKNSHEKKGNVKTVAEKRGRKKSREKKRLHSYKKARAPTGFAMCPSFLLPWGRFNYSSSACTNRLYKQVSQCAFAHS